MKKREVNVTAEQGDKILEAAKATSQRDYLILACALKAGLRRSEVVGESDRRDGHWPLATFLDVAKDKVKHHRETILKDIGENGVHLEHRPGFDKPWSWVIENGFVINYNDPENMLTGLRIEDFDWENNGVWLRGKKQDRERFHPFPLPLLEEIKTFIGAKSKGRLFNVSGSLFWLLCHKYAKMAGIPDFGRVHPHRLRHSFITQAYRKTRDPVKTQRLARHKSFQTTTGYIAESSPEELAEDMQKVWS